MAGRKNWWEVPTHRVSGYGTRIQYARRHRWMDGSVFSRHGGEYGCFSVFLVCASFVGIVFMWGAA